MALTSDEQRMLAGIECTLSATDPHFALRMSFDDVRLGRRLREMFAGVAFMVGLGVMLIGVVVRPEPLAATVLVSVAGAVAAVAAASWLSLRDDHW
jgi:Protein of unknown function (DUF3040)